MKVYIVTIIHNGEGTNDVLGSLKPDIYKSHSDALRFCKEECETMNRGIIYDSKTQKKLILSDNNRWYKEPCNINKQELYDNEYAFYIIETDLIQNSWLIDM